MSRFRLPAVGWLLWRSVAAAVAGLAWEAAYGLQADSPLPPSAIALPPRVPPPPHLEDCVALTAWRWAQEQWEAGEGGEGGKSGSGGEAGDVGEGKGEASGETGKVGAEKKGESGEGLQGMGGRGKLPPWAAQSHPQPPWILGSDAANLAMTRVAQRDIWAHQFPPGGDCSNERLLLVDWPSSVHGIGSQLHIMSAILSLAMRFKRVLVPSGGSFTRASHADCNATGTYASFHCYFFPLVSPACEYQAELAVAAAAAANETLPRMTEESKEGVLGSEQRVVWFHGEPYNGLRFEGDVSRWPNAYRERPNSIELVGFVGEGDETRQRVHWWRAQSIRFLLRSPSAYLCHITNRVRHTSYGLSVAAHLAASAAHQAALAHSHPEILSSAWAERRPNSCSCGSTDSTSETNTAGVTESSAFRRLALGAEPYVPRPIVSVHVRQGDKGSEMQLNSFAAFMFFAYRLRRVEPELRHVWLSTEMQSAIDQTAQFKDWSFHYSHNPRQNSTKFMVDYERDVGHQLVGISFANLIISSQCDYFVGALGSNWNRLINELRVTNGRLFRGYVTLNNYEF
ncbi:unnamed protein product [Closterium sp. NIES-64]|nr:unnamed protein product [Closterium sp. NIES-64]